MCQSCLKFVGLVDDSNAENLDEVHSKATTIERIMNNNGGIVFGNLHSANFISNPSRTFAKSSASRPHAHNNATARQRLLQYV